MTVKAETSTPQSSLETASKCMCNPRLHEKSCIKYGAETSPQGSRPHTQGASSNVFGLRVRRPTKPLVTQESDVEDSHIIGIVRGAGSKSRQAFKVDGKAVLKEKFTKDLMGLQQRLDMSR